MAKPSTVRTKVSAKGKVILPKAIRHRRGWTAGVELIVEDRPEDVLLRTAPTIGSAKIEDVFGCLGPVDRVVWVEEMHQGLLDEAARRYRNAVDDRD